MNGGNLYASVRQILEAERTIRVKNLVKLNLELSEIRHIFAASETEDSHQINKIASEISGTIEAGGVFEKFVALTEADQNVLFYIAGHFARSFSLQTSCDSCKKCFLFDKEALQNPNTIIHFVDSDGSERDYYNQVNRGGLTAPSEQVYLLCIQAWQIYQIITKNPELNQLLRKDNVSARKVFESVVKKHLEDCEDLRLIFFTPCESGHSFEKFTLLLAQRVFNLFSKNFVSSRNSEIHSNKRQRSSTEKKREPSFQKSVKLQNESV